MTSKVATAAPTHPEGLATAVVIGRAGSKGLPGKNARIVAGRPMIAHTLAHARAARSVERIVVSTDDPRLIEVARATGGVEVVERPPALASDTATVDAAVRHAIEALDDRAAHIVVLYANVPVRPPGLIDRAVELLARTGCDSVQSYAPVGKYHPYWEVRLDAAGRVEPYVANAVYRRQDLPPLFIPDGGVIAVTRASLFRVVGGQPHAFFGHDRRGVVNSEGEVIDIDTEIDLAVAETVLTRSAATAPDAPSPRSTPSGLAVAGKARAHAHR